MIVIGVGTRWRGDDVAGLEVARRLRGRVAVREHEGDGAGLVEAWAGAADVVVVDAAASGAAPGTVRRFDARAEPLPARALRSSSHAFGVADAVELARALGRLPDRLEVYAIEGADFSTCVHVSPAVERAVDELVAVLSGAERQARRQPPAAVASTGGAGGSSASSAARGTTSTGHAA